MTTEELVKYVKDTLTGGGLVPLNVTIEAVKAFVHDGLQRVTPYYKETAIFETVDVAPSQGGSGYSGSVSLTSLAHEVHIVEDVVGVDSPDNGLSILRNYAGLLGLDKSIVMDTFAVDYALWRQHRNDMVKAIGRNMSFRVITEGDGTKTLFIDDVANRNYKVTVVYAPVPADLGEVTHAQIISWIKDWTIANVELTQSRVMGRVKSDTLGFQLNSDELRMRGEAKIEKLEEKLPDLYFSYGTSRKS